MENGLVPRLLLLALPALYFAARLGLAERPLARRLGWLVLALVVLPAAPWSGADPDYLLRLTLLIALAAAVVLALRSAGAKRQPQGGLMTALAGLSVLVYFNFLAFHGGRTFVHHHDMAHYYLGSKYYGELGYTDLYAAMLRAEAELHRSLPTHRVRDLETYEVMPAAALVAASDRVRAAFSAPRWSAFLRDTELFHQSMGSGWPSIFMDHGFNATPAWALVGGAIAGLVPAGSRAGMLLLALLDTALLVAVFVAVAWALGRRTVPLAVLHFSIIFGASFFWVGGAYLRFSWLSAVIVAACCLARGKHLAAGALLGLATGLRLFPVLLVLPLAAKAASHLLRRAPGRRRYLRLGAAFAGSLVLVVALTGLLPGGFANWTEFRENSSRHLGILSPNVVSLTQVLALPEEQAQVSWEEYRALGQRRARIYRWQLALVFVPLLLLTARIGRWQTDLGALALGLPLLLVGLNLAAYYWVVLVLLVLVWRNHDDKLALIFAAEAAAYCLALFVDREAALYAGRSVALGILFAALLLPSVGRELRQARRRREAASPERTA